MDITDATVSQGKKSKKMKNKKSMKKSEEASGAEKKEAEEKKMENSEPATALPSTSHLHQVKNKQRRHLMFIKLKQEKKKVPTSWDTGQSCH